MTNVSFEMTDRMDKMYLHVDIINPDVCTGNICSFFLWYWPVISTVDMID